MRMSTKDDLEKRALFLAAVCGQTYDQFMNKDGSFVVPLNYVVRQTIEANSITSEWERFGFILESPEEIIIAFRGTISTTNWIADAIASQTRFPYLQQECYTHRGFTDIYTSARSQIISRLALMPSNKTLYVTGHSLGAALATLCAMDVAVNSSFAPLLFTFGSPRVGDPAFAQAFTQYVPYSYRYANLFDIVTYAPPAVYKLPKRDKKYYYTHVHTSQPLGFQNGSVGGNHVIGSYYTALSKQQPEYSLELACATPGLCPGSGTSS